jgi:hypothetical protein
MHSNEKGQLEHMRVEPEEAGSSRRADQGISEKGQVPEVPTPPTPSRSNPGDCDPEVGIIGRVYAVILTWPVKAKSASDPSTDPVDCPSTTEPRDQQRSVAGVGTLTAQQHRENSE